MGHIDYSGIGGSFISYLYTFNVALFFVVSGYMWRAKPNLSLWSVVARKFRQIYLPYAVLFLISILYGHLIVRFAFQQYVIPFEWRPSIKAFLFSSEWLNSVPTFNFALWFLPIFFIATVAFELLQKIRNMFIYTAVIALIFAASIPIQHLIPGRPMLNINVLPVALVLMGCGFLLKKVGKIEKINLFFLIVLFAFTLLASYYFPGNIGGIGSYWFFPSALASFVLYLRLAQQFRSSSFLGYIGRNSLIIFGVHGLIAATYPFTGIHDYLSGSWNGLMLYLVNLAYVVLASVVAVIVYRWVRGQLTSLVGLRRPQLEASGK